MVGSLRKKHRSHDCSANFYLLRHKVQLSNGAMARDIYPRYRGTLYLTAYFSFSSSRGRPGNEASTHHQFLIFAFVSEIFTHLKY